MNKMIKIGQFLRILDENKQLSITNIALIIILIKLAIAPVTTLTELGTLLIALGNYSHKRSIIEKKRYKVIK